MRANKWAGDTNEAPGTLRAWAKPKEAFAGEFRDGDFCKRTDPLRAVSRKNPATFWSPRVGVGEAGPPVATGGMPIRPE
jgi:hypothetical protein